LSSAAPKKSTTVVFSDDGTPSRLTATGFCWSWSRSDAATDRQTIVSETTSGKFSPTTR
jgi:hypothetical protein